MVSLNLCRTDAGHDDQECLTLDLPPFPSTASHLVSELNRDDADTRRVMQLIECEPKIAGKVIQLANSPLFNASREITTISHALVVLGFRSVAQLSLALVTGELFQNKEAKIETALRSIYKHSLGVAVVARVITAEGQTLANHAFYECDKTLPDEAFLCGVMHDIGRIVLLNAQNESYLDQQDGLGTQELLDLETSLFGCQHTDVGQACVQAWELPLPISRSIGDHHQRIENVSDPLTKAIVFANSLARRWGIGCDASHEWIDDMSFTAASAEANQLDDLDCDLLKELSKKQFDSIATICF